VSFVKIDENGKGGFACSKSIDLEIGCRNACKGCYGSKTTYMSESYFHNIKIKDYDEKKFRSSCKSTFSKGFRNIRFSKHSDSASSHLSQNFKSVLKIAGEEGLKLVVVSKSLTYDGDVAKLMKEYKHTLHISLGMITKAQSEDDRLKVGIDYRMADVNTKWRIVEDVTKPIPDKYNMLIVDNCIITPMRYASKTIAAEYGIDHSKYKYVNGYYRPQEIEEDWEVFNNWCGEVGSEVKCCKCLVVEDDSI
jgi:hypothetical protein